MPGNSGRMTVFYIRASLTTTKDATVRFDEHMELSRDEHSLSLNPPHSKFSIYARPNFHLGQT